MQEGAGALSSVILRSWSGSVAWGALMVSFAGSLHG